MPVSDAILTQILSQLENLSIQQQTLQAKVCLLVRVLCRSVDIVQLLQLDSLTNQPSSPPLQPVASSAIPIPTGDGSFTSLPALRGPINTPPAGSSLSASQSPKQSGLADASLSNEASKEKAREKALYPSRVILTSMYN